MPAVEPAETTAAAWPRCTSWQATAMLERGRRQLASAPSSMPSESSAVAILIPPGRIPAGSSGRTRPGRPVRMTGMPCSVTAATAPATTCSGA